MISPAEKKIDWMECYIKIPEGRDIGEYVVLLDFQREMVRAIYNNSGEGWQVPGFYKQMFDARDSAALKQAMKAMVLADEKRVHQLEKMIELKREHWRIGLFAAYVCQVKTLRLHPSEEPPCHINFPDTDESDGAKLLRRMLAAGVSKFHPDPQKAIAAAAK
jgi:hypothetical protein